MMNLFKVNNKNTRKTSHFYNLRKRQKTRGFLKVFGGIETQCHSCAFIDDF